MIPIPYLLGGVALYFMFSGRRVQDVLNQAASNVTSPVNNSANGSGTWTQPASQPNTANGTAQTISDIATSVGAVANVIGGIVNWFQPPSAKDTNGQASNGASGSSTIPPYLAASDTSPFASFWK